MDHTQREQAFLPTLGTEHVVLQTGANATISEAGTRASPYIMALSSSLVAMAFAPSRGRPLFPSLPPSCP